jgi:hypothetical protein
MALSSFSRITPASSSVRIPASSFFSTAMKTASISLL